MQVGKLRHADCDTPPAISDREPGIASGPFRPEGRKLKKTGYVSGFPNISDQATLSDDGSILTPGPMVDEIATRLT
jgi:hypothetical protein